MPVFVVFGCGALFGLGLLISGMTQPAKILNFLDFAAVRTGRWDPTLLVVMAGALAVTFAGYVVAQRRSGPMMATKSFWPTRSDIDMPLVAGAVLFGIGWGLVGLCPGPALVNLVTASPKVFVFVAAMVVGMMLHDRVWTPWSYVRRYGLKRAGDDD